MEYRPEKMLYFDSCFNVLSYFDGLNLAAAKKEGCKKVAADKVTRS